MQDRGSRCKVEKARCCGELGVNALALVKAPIACAAAAGSDVELAAL